MTAKKRSSRILDAVHQTARDLHRLGFIDARRMREYDALCHHEAVEPFHRDGNDKADSQH